MTTYRHAEEMRWTNHPDFNPVCMACVREIAKSPCIAATPDPDYTSLVRDHEGRLQRGLGPDYRCATCGHAVEPAP